MVRVCVSSICERRFCVCVHFLYNANHSIYTSITSLYTCIYLYRGLYFKIIIIIFDLNVVDFGNWVQFNWMNSNELLTHIHTMIYDWPYIQMLCYCIDLFDSTWKSIISNFWMIFFFRSCHLLYWILRLRHNNIDMTDSTERHESQRKFNKKYIYL